MEQPLLSSEVEDSAEFLRLQDRYKQDLMEDMRLNTASKLAAKQHALLESDAPDAWKRPQLKAVGRQLRHWVKRVRQPFGATGAPGAPAREEEGEDFDAGPMQVIVKELMKTIKKPTAAPSTSVATPPPQKKKKKPRGALTPVVTPPPRRPPPPETPLTGFEPLPGTSAEPDDDHAYFSDVKDSLQRRKAVIKGKQLVKKHLEKKAKEAAKEGAKQAFKKWLDYK